MSDRVPKSNRYTREWRAVKMARDHGLSPAHAKPQQAGCPTCGLTARKHETVGCGAGQ